MAGALASLWKIVMNGGQLSTFCDILEEQVRLCIGYCTATRDTPVDWDSVGFLEDYFLASEPA